jgi:pimeloyl-ACP methyl ester carboxylesterase
MFKDTLKFMLLFSGMVFLFSQNLSAQKLKPGFDKDEFIEMVKIYSRQGDSSFFYGIPDPADHKLVYRSPIVGLDNRYDLWVSSNNIAVLSIRGTTSLPISWLQNYYSGMVPANGEISLNEKKKFKYHLSDREGAAVHAGWVIGFAYLADDMIPKLDSCYKAGIRDFIVLGHSQGGAIGYYLTSQFKYMQRDGALPADMNFKTICFAAPKPGNTQYAYDFEYLTRNGWSYNAINVDDWVPETPAGVQMNTDFNKTNPFTDPEVILNAQKFGQRFVLKVVFKKLNKNPRQAHKVFKRYLGNRVYDQINKALPFYEEPDFFPSSNYVRTANVVVMSGDEEYHKLYPESPTNFTVHHMMQPYYYLATHYR